MSVAIELSALELDVISGGLGGVSILNPNQFADTSATNFNQSQLLVQKASFSGPLGSGRSIGAATSKINTAEFDSTIVH